MKARYIRVSGKNQNTARQEARLFPDETPFIDHISGAVPFQDRPAAKDLFYRLTLNEVESISVSSIDRLGRNNLDILQTIQLFTKHGVNLHIDNLGLDSLTSDGKPNHIFNLITSVMASISEMEKATLRERQLEGIAEAKKAGIYKGREKGTTESREEFLAKHGPTVKAIRKNPEMSLRNLRKIATEGDYNPSVGTIKKVKEVLNEKGVA